MDHSIEDFEKLDRDELEARLYEQIYYSNDRTEDNMECNFTEKSNTQTVFPAQVSFEQSSDKQKSVTGNQQEPTIQPEITADHKKKRKANDDKQEKKSKKSRKNNSSQREKQKDKVLNKRKEIREGIENNLNKKKLLLNLPVLNFNEQDNNENLSDAPVECSPPKRKKSKNENEVVIDLTMEENEKYNVESKKNISTKAENVQEAYCSDSEESIFEVPVPPKPAPPVVDLDSDDTNDKSSKLNLEDSREEEDLNESSVSKIVTNSRADPAVAEVVDDLFDSSDESIKSCEEIEQNKADKQNQEPDLILNCTPVRKRCDDLNEIKQLNVQSCKKTSTPRRNSNSCFPVFPREPDEAESVAEKSYFPAMIKSMRDFYNKSWGGENFELEDALNKMPGDATKWTILDEDMVGNASTRYWDVCKNCKKPGHTTKKCPNNFQNKRVMVKKMCFMCGSKEHIDLHCPQRMCLTCGVKQRSYRKTCDNCRKIRCKSCKSVGHTMENCPDNWRRFHSTTSENNILIPDKMKNVMKPKNQLVCCNCTQRGHDSSTCTRYRWSPHFPTPVFVSNYKINSKNQEHNVVNQKVCPVVSQTVNQEVGQVVNPEVSQVVNPFARTFDLLFGKSNGKKSRKKPTNIQNPSFILPQPVPLLELKIDPPIQALFPVRPPSQVCSEIPNPSVLNLVVSKSTVTSQDLSNNQIVLDLFALKPEHKEFEYPLNDLKKEVEVALLEKKLNISFLIKLQEESSFKLIIKRTVDAKYSLIIYSCKKFIIYVRELVMLWLQRTPDEQKHMIVIPLNYDKFHSFKISMMLKLLNPAEEPPKIWDEINELAHQTNESYSATISKHHDKYVSLNMSLYKFELMANAKMNIVNYCTIINNKFKNFTKNRRLYLHLLYYINIFFVPYHPLNLEQMISTYKFKKNKGIPCPEIDVSQFLNSETCNLPNNTNYQYSPSAPNNNTVLKPCKGLGMLNNAQPNAGNPSHQNESTQENVIQYIQNIIDQPLPFSVSTNYTSGNNCININVGNSYKKNVYNNAKLKKTKSPKKRPKNIKKPQAKIADKQYVMSVLNRIKFLNLPELKSVQFDLQRKLKEDINIKYKQVNRLRKRLDKLNKN